MAASDKMTIAKLVGDNESEILPEWLELQKETGALQTGRMTEAELAVQSREFLHRLRAGLAAGGIDKTHAAYGPALEFLSEISRSRALQGFSPAETAKFVFSLKQPLFNAVNGERSLSAKEIAQMTWAITMLLDELGLHSFEVFQKSREEVILRQQQRNLRAVDAGRQTVGRHSGAADDRHAGQRAHPGRDGEPAAAASSTTAPRSRSSTSPACRRWTRWSRSICSRRSRPLA